MSHDASPRVEYGTDETLERSGDATDRREVAELQRLFEDVTGESTVVDEQDAAAATRDATDDPAVSTDAVDDGLTEAIGKPDVDTTM